MYLRVKQRSSPFCGPLRCNLVGLLCPLKELSGSRKSELKERQFTPDPKLDGMATEEWSVLKTAIVTLLNNDSNEVLWDLQIRNLKRVCVLKHFYGCYHHWLRGHVTSWSTKKGNPYLIFIFRIFWLKEHISYWSVGVLAHWFPHLQNSQGLSAYLWIIICTASISFIHIKHRLYNVFTVFVWKHKGEVQLTWWNPR